MPEIHKLSPQLADMIAAGEVVERPASVIKELIENAVDAGAAHVTVEIKNGGIIFMRVTDDGCGMSREDAPTAFLRHATSKISTQEDLGHIVTMGFRGEALAAISAVSRIDLLTRQEGDLDGSALRVEAGNVLDIQPAGCPRGTTIIVRDLFFNTPARMKFLKRDSVEGSYIGGAVQRQALAHPEVAFRYIRDGKEELRTAGDGELRSAIYAVLGRQTAMEMVEVHSESSGVTISGFVGRPTASRGNRNYQHFFVNDRYVKSRMMGAALEEAYKNQMMVGRFPTCVLHVAVLPTAVDVNVHPAKTEVKFLREGDVFDAIHYGVLGALNQSSGRVEMKPGVATAAKQGFYKSMTPQEFKAVAGTLEQSRHVTPSKELAQLLQEKKADRAEVHDAVRMVPTTEAAPPMPVPGPKKELRQTPRPVDVLYTELEPEPEQAVLPMPAPMPEMPKAAPSAQPAAPAAAPYRIIGQTMDTYILVEQDESLLLIDKHAAHERIHFEALKQQKAEMMSQLLLRPLPVKLLQEEAATLLEREAELQTLGFTVEDFGSGTLLVRAIPADIAEKDTEACLSELAQVWLEGRKLDPDAVRDALLHTIACKAAIKGGQTSEPQELAALVQEVLSRDDLKYCPHGRPICITLSKKNIEKQFKRT